MEIDPGLGKKLLQLCGRAIVSQRSHKPRLDTQACQVCGDVACSPRSLPLALDFNQRNRSFVGNTQGTAFEIAIQNEIADDEQLDAREIADDLGKPVFVDFQTNLFSTAAWLPQSSPLLSLSSLHVRVSSFSSSSQMMCTTARWDS